MGLPAVSEAWDLSFFEELIWEEDDTCVCSVTFKEQIPAEEKVNNQVNKAIMSVCLNRQCDWFCLRCDLVQQLFCSCVTATAYSVLSPDAIQV